MSKTFLLSPEDVTKRLLKRYRNQCRNWLIGGGEWPLKIGLGFPSEREALNRVNDVRAWQDAWVRWRGPGEVRWLEKRWTSLGTQRLPESLEFGSADAVAACIAETDAWSRARQRFERIIELWPILTEAAPRYFDILAGWSDSEFDRLINLLTWFSRNTTSGLYIRQVPVPGVDTKWIESRKVVVHEWLRTIKSVGDTSDLYALVGLRRLPDVLRLRVLDEELRRLLGGLSDIQAPVDELARLRLPVERVFIVENLQTGLAFEDIEGAIVFMGQGYAVDAFGALPWLKGTPIYYWGDLDTHGFAILDRLRRYFPDTQSMLMDTETLLEHRALWGCEECESRASELSCLSGEEKAVFEGLQKNQWGVRVRLEQERIPWAYAWKRVVSVEQQFPQDSS